jgi:hypothetical protein
MRFHSGVVVFVEGGMVAILGEVGETAPRLRRAGGFTLDLGEG